MTEKELREKLAKIDELRERSKLLSEIARWPMGVPSEMRADKSRGWFKSIWRGSGETSFGEVVLTREERREIADWMHNKAADLTREAEDIAAKIGANTPIE